MPIRLPLLLATLSLVLLVPAAARAADYVPDEVIVRYEEGTGGGRESGRLEHRASGREGAGGGVPLTRR